MSKFNIGDKVKCISTGTSLERDKIYTVKRLDKDGDPIVDGQPDWKSTNCGHYARCFELVKPEEKTMRTFKVGDRVEVVEQKTGIAHKGDTGVVIYSSSWKNDRDGDGENHSLGTDCYELKILDKLSIYDSIKYQIEGLKDGWTKEADDIIQKIKGKHDLMVIDGTSYRNSKIIIYSGNPIEFKWPFSDAEKTFTFYNQCEKMTAFKSALFWLLDHSDIKKNEKQEKIEELKKQMEKIQEDIKNLEE